MEEAIKNRVTFRPRIGSAMRSDLSFVGAFCRLSEKAMKDFVQGTMWCPFGIGKSEEC